MGERLILAVLFAVAVVLACRALRVWLDAGRHGLGTVHRLGWAVVGGLWPSRYWWGARIAMLPAAERTALLDAETTALGLSRADGLRCPLCQVGELPSVWVLDGDSRPTVAHGPLECPRCGFRLDACRHCARFLPGPPPVWGELPWQAGDITFGRCSYYKASQPVEQVASPTMARQLRERGYDVVRAPLPIVDSFVPPDFCSVFQPHRPRLRFAGVPWPGAKRRALLRMLVPGAGTESSPTDRPADSQPSDDEQWLM